MDPTDGRLRDHCDRGSGSGTAVFFFVNRDPTIGPDQQWALLDRYCVGCHNDAEFTGELSFERIKGHPLEANQKIWEAVIRKLRLGAMPPQGEPTPSDGQARALVRYLECRPRLFLRRESGPGAVAHSSDE